MMINILLESSIIGQGQYIESARTGVYRVVDALINELIASNECNITMWSDGGGLDSAGIDRYVRRFGANKNIQSYTKYDLVILGKIIAQIKKIYDNIGLSQKWKNRLRSQYSKFDDNISNIHSAQSIPDYMLKNINVCHIPFIMKMPAKVREAAWIRKFITIHDLIPVTHPQYSMKHTTDHLASTLKDIRSDDYIFTVSKYVKDEVCKYLNHDPTKIFVTPLAADPSLFYRVVDHQAISSMRKYYSIPEGPYILSLATFQPRKKIDHLIRVFCNLVENGYLKDLNLILAGAEGWDFQNITNELKNAKNIKKRIKTTGFVRDLDLAALYSGALAFIYPSKLEGFGLPPLEAMQCGTPVIVSNATSLPEVVGDAGIQVDPDDEDALAQNILKLYSDSTLRDELAARAITRAKLFSWHRHAREVLSAYNTTLNGG